MALIKLSGLLTGMSGKLGGSIIAQTSNGNYLKQNSFSQQHPTAAQSLQRTQIYPVTQNWRSLTPTQQAAWVSESPNYPYTDRLGGTSYYTGFQLFTKLNLNRLLIGETVLNTPATYVNYVLSTPSNYSFTPNTKIIQYTGGSNDMEVLFYFTSGLNFQTSIKNQKFRLIAHLPVNTAVGTWQFTSAYTDIFGLVPRNSYVTVKVRYVVRSTGYASGFVQQFTKQVL